MKAEIIRDYETDLELFLSLLASARIGEKKKTVEYTRTLWAGAKIAYEIVVAQILFRLCYLDPDKYPFFQGEDKDRYIESRIIKLIKEKTNGSQKA